MHAEHKVSNDSAKALLRQPVFWFYGSASIAFAIKDNAFSYLLLMYCNQVLGLPGYLAARAMAIALVWDAILDMLIGHLSDKTNSHLGRRHPYMYASLFILPPSFYALFNPVVALSPGTPHRTFLYILAVAITVRTGTALFEIPSAAQLPDLEQDYQRRNAWYAIRFFFWLVWRSHYARDQLYLLGWCSWQCIANWLLAVCTEWGHRDFLGDLDIFWWHAADVQWPFVEVKTFEAW